MLIATVNDTGQRHGLNESCAEQRAMQRQNASSLGKINTTGYDGGGLDTLPKEHTTDEEQN